jgi:hypothetical protein
VNLPGPFSGHSYITGTILIAVGAFGIFGSLSGNLAPMIAALFAPQYLDATQGANNTNAQGVTGELTKANSLAQEALETNPITAPLTILKGLIP